MRKLLAVLVLVLVASSCSREANIASRNLSKAAEQFQVMRRVVFYNGINGEYILSLEGFCSVEEVHSQLQVTCKTGNKEYKKHFLGLSDNVTYFAEQIEANGVSVDHYKVIFKPSSIVPDVDVE